MTKVIVNGNTYSDDGTSSKDMRDGGHRTWLLPMISDAMIVINQWLGGSFSTGIRTVTASGAQTVATSDNIIKWQPSGTISEVVFTLPGSPALGQRHEFVHRQPIAGQIHPLTVKPLTGTINAKPQVSIQAPAASFSVIHLGANDWTMEGNPASPSPYPNVLINAGMQIDQESEGQATTLVSGVQSYAVDQWQAIYSSTATGVTVQRVADSPFDSGNSIKVTTTVAAAVATGHYLFLRQVIESAEIASTGSGTASAQPWFLSFWVKSSIAPYVASGALQTYGATRSAPFNFRIEVANTWEHKVVAIPADTAGTWAGAQLVICLAAGATYQSAANVWTASNRFATTTNTNTLLSTSLSTFNLTAVKLECGLSPTPYLQNSLAEDLARCQRFYEKSYNAGNIPGANTGAGTIRLIGEMMGKPAGSYVRFMQVKRATPTIYMYSLGSLIGGTGAAMRIRDNTATADILPVVYGTGQGGFNWYATPASNDIDLIAHYVADARF